MTGQYILEGKTAIPCDDLKAWARMFGDRDARRVADDKIRGVRVSTVFLGLDHQWGVGPPLLFETMVFEGPLDGEMERYSTWAEAEKGHAAMIERVKAAADSPPSGNTADQ